MDGEERWRRTRPRSRGSESSPRPNDSPDAAKRPLRHRRAGPIGVVSVTSPGLLPTPSAIRNSRLVPRARRRLDESPVTLRVFVWTERRARCTGRVLPMRQAHRSGTRRCSYRFCHRDRSASTRPTLTNLAGPAGTPWQGSPRITPRTELPRLRSAVPNASGFELRLFRTCAVAGGIAARPGSECPTREGRTRWPCRRYAASLRHPAGAENECGDIRARQHHDSARPRTLGARAGPRRRARTLDPRCHPPSGRAA